MDLLFYNDHIVLVRSTIIISISSRPNRLIVNAIKAVIRLISAYIIKFKRLLDTKLCMILFTNILNKCLLNNINPLSSFN